jgi:hypothetical protein
MRIACLLCLLLLSSPARSQPAQPQLSWLEGRWIGKDNDSEVLEIWLPPAVDGMSGVSETRRDGKQQHREFLWFEPRHGGMRLRVAWPSPEGLKISQFSEVELNPDGFVARDPRHHGESLRYNLLPTGELEIIQNSHRLLLHRETAAVGPKPVPSDTSAPLPPVH